MALWIALAALAQLITAGVVFVDKYVLVSKTHIGKPVVYAFYISLLSGFVLVLVPFGLVSIPSTEVLFLSLLASVTFISSIVLLYTALKEGHASDIMPVVGSVAAVATALCANLWLHEDLPQAFVPAFGLMVFGMLLISHFRLTNRQKMLVIFSGIFFGATAFLTKLIFLETSFLDGFFWSRMTNVVGALFLLALPANRAAIFSGYRGSSSGTKWLVVSNKTLGGIAAILTLLAISLGSVSIVQALAGLQFVFLLLIAYFFSRYFPAVLRGEMDHKGRAHKLGGIACIALGLALLFVV
ncbi:hypothetical protein A2704_03380 [Candidatus Kaiserbacteria bacterium RIFCSPHIGHO2_01_FULL_54_36b]|uniref:EamA domain-containing protein n=1 Tax=Candidatus Kaiserbacteria bacterium RIFCSPHIGHO2_01_FULL_54_36b TaxID=1798483 RepID=A0A1F6CQG4_9BACT|nr:MAG: hypothetical protein A2704_03380 [Candidatus Kaiserbacteria bacterium RIFCSPHIGHO2_01_FULL_54_36b]